MNGILDLTPSGLYCGDGDFYIDPWLPVKRAVITHAHADHAKSGSRSYLCTQDSKALLQARLGREANIETLDYGEVLPINSVKISLHPAGHILGSAQVKIDQGGHVCVVSGDYKTDADPTCLPLEPLALSHVYQRMHVRFADIQMAVPGPGRSMRLMPGGRQIGIRGAPASCLLMPWARHSVF